MCYLWVRRRGRFPSFWNRMVGGVDVMVVEKKKGFEAQGGGREGLGGGILGCHSFFFILGNFLKKIVVAQYDDSSLAVEEDL